MDSLLVGEMKGVDWMSNMLLAEVEIKGDKPLMWHHFGPDAIPLEKQETTGVAGNDPEEWKKTVMVTKEGQLFVEPNYIFACVRAGSKHTKKGRGSIQPLVEATLQVLDDRVLVDRFLPDGNGSGPLSTDSTEPVYLDIRSVKNPSTKARNVRYRVTASSGWRMKFRLLWDKTIVSRAQMEAIVIDAGRLAGIGDGRKIGMGRFSIERFEVRDA